MPTIEGNGPKPARGARRFLGSLKALYRLVPISLRRHRLYRRRFGKLGNFRNPRSYNEKMQWRIINDRRDWIGVACDKLASKEYVRRVAAATGLPIRIPETDWVGTDVRELQQLSPRIPARWVFKPNHSSGRYRLFDANEEPVDWNELIALGESWLKPDEEIVALGHFGYSIARKLLIAEQRVGEKGVDPAPCGSRGSNGNALDHWATIDAHSNRTSFLCDSSFKPLDPHVRWAAKPNDPRSPHLRLDAAARKQLNDIVVALTDGFDFLRVDYYLCDGFWFGEYSPYSSSGLIDFGPELDQVWSSAWSLPDLSRPDPRESLWRELLARTERGTLQR